AVVLQALNAAMDARNAEQKETESDDVTAVTSEPPDQFAQHRADALTTLANSPRKMDAELRWRPGV
ncbi:MAG: hypothetical protein GY815_11670, partial [Gammaproteobacteria bacterium]|nr:hypothetical protein [Gammaproteobacteria bacterium]